MRSQRLGRHPQLQDASRSAPSLRRGSNGPGVGELQSLLADIGFALTVSLGKGQPDGVYGAETEKAVKDFQRGNGLLVDGIAGRETINALDDIVASNSMLEVPSDAEEKADLVEDSLTPISRSNSAYW